MKIGICTEMEIGRIRIDRNPDRLLFSLRPKPRSLHPLLPRNIWLCQLRHRVDGCAGPCPRPASTRSRSSRTTDRHPRDQMDDARHHGPRHSPTMTQLAAHRMTISPSPTRDRKQGTMVPLQKNFDTNRCPASAMLDANTIARSGRKKRADHAVRPKRPAWGRRSGPRGQFESAAIDAPATVCCIAKFQRARQLRFPIPRAKMLRGRQENFSPPSSLSVRRAGTRFSARAPRSYCPAAIRRTGALARGSKVGWAFRSLFTDLGSDCHADRGRGERRLERMHLQSLDS
jgi:hypothetical protein